jgi:hypothetical protein
VVSAGKIQIQYVPTAQNIADIFTKPLQAPRFRELRETLVVDLSPILQAGKTNTAAMLASFDKFFNLSNHYFIHDQ